MRDYDEFDEERDLKRTKDKEFVTEFGDRLKRSDIYAGIVIMISIAAMATSACIAGCEYVKKQINKRKVPTTSAVTNVVQRARISVHDCR